MWLKWLKDESCGTIDMSNVKHFLITDSEFVSEVATYDDPKIGQSS